MGKIKNFDQLATTDLRRDALNIAEAGLAAIDTKTVVKNLVKLEKNRICIGDQICSLDQTERVFVTGIGKCVFDAAEALEEILADRLTGGLVIGVEEHELPKIKKIKVFAGTHPMPTDENIKAAEALVDELTGLTEHDLVLVVVSGGGSTLLCLPKSESCVEEKMVLHSLTTAGATIQEINTVRKHLSLARGGYLAKYAYPAQVIGLIFSDVPGDDYQFIASGPTVLDETTVNEAKEILKKYAVIEGPMKEKIELIETPKDDKFFKRVQNIIIASNHTALEAMRSKATEIGYNTEICQTCLEGEAKEIGWKIAHGINEAEPNTAHLYGGETTVTVAGSGKGGRNQELTLSALTKVNNNEIVISLASDGVDNTDAAGGIGDYVTKESAEKLKLDPFEFLTENDSYTFFEKTSNQIITGKTGSNVSDLVIALKG